MKAIILGLAVLATGAQASPYCNSENFASPECTGEAAYLKKGKGDTRNSDYTYCEVDQDNWGRYYFECVRKNGKVVRVPTKYVPYCDGSEAFGSAAWWSCHSNGN